MADAVVRLRLDPAQFQTGARASVASLDQVRTHVSKLPASMRAVSGALDGVTARFRVLGRTGAAVWQGQSTVASGAAAKIQAAGLRAGTGFARTLATGLRAGTPGAVGATDQLLREVDRRLPRSDAATGPLSDLTRSGRAIPETLAAGIRSGRGSLTREIDRMASDARRRISTIQAPQTIGARFQQSRAAGNVPPPPPAGFLPGRAPAAPAPVPGRAAPAPVPVPGRAPAGGQGAPDGFAKLWALSALGGQVRQLSQRLRQTTDTAVDTMSTAQSSLAELRTVITPEHSFAGMTREQTIAKLEDRASQTARNRTEAGRVVGGLNREQVLESYFAAASSGTKGEAIIPVAEQSALLAKAGQTTARQAGVLLTTMFNQWGDQAAIANAAPAQRAQVTQREVERISDLIARTQDSFATPGGLNELGPAFARVSPVAKAMSFGLTETAVGLGVLADAGFRGALGGNKLRMVIDDLDISMQKLGLSTVRNADGTRSLEGSLRAIGAAGVDENQLVKAFGKQAAPGLLALLGDIERFEEGLTNVKGATRENAREHQNTYANKLGNFNDALSELQINFGEGAADVRSLGLAVGTGLVNAVNAAGPGFARVAGSFAQVIGMAGGVASGALDMSVGLHAFLQLTGRADGFKGMFRDMRGGIGRSRRGFKRLFAFMASTMDGFQLPGGGGGSGGGKPKPPPKVSRRVPGGNLVGSAVGGGAVKLATIAAGAATVAALVGAVAASVIDSNTTMNKLEAERTARIRAERDKLTPEQTKVKTEAAREGQTIGARFRRAQEDEGKGFFGAAFDALGFGGVTGALSTGIDGGGAELGAATDKALKPVDDRMAHSDARVGPLSNLTASGAAIPVTLAQGVALGAPVLASAVNAALASVGLQPGEGGAVDALPGAATSPPAGIQPLVEPAAAGPPGTLPAPLGGPGIQPVTTTAAAAPTGTAENTRAILDLTGIVERLARDIEGVAQRRKKPNESEPYSIELLDNLGLLSAMGR